MTVLVDGGRGEAFTWRDRRPRAAPMAMDAGGTGGDGHRRRHGGGDDRGGSGAGGDPPTTALARRVNAYVHPFYGLRGTPKVQEEVVAQENDNRKKHLSPLQSIRQHCSKQCLTEPRGAYLCCPDWDCPLWRFRDGRDPCGKRRANSCSFACQTTASEASFAPDLPCEVSDGIKARNQFSVNKTPPRCRRYSGFHGEPGYKDKERPLRAIRRFCTNCTGAVGALKECCSLSCPLFIYRFGRRPTSGK